MRREFLKNSLPSVIQQSCSKLKTCITPGEPSEIDRKDWLVMRISRGSPCVLRLMALQLCCSTQGK